MLACEKEVQCKIFNEEGCLQEKNTFFSNSIENIEEIINSLHNYLEVNYVIKDAIPLLARNSPILSTTQLPNKLYFTTTNPQHSLYYLHNSPLLPSFPANEIKLLSHIDTPIDIKIYPQNAGKCEYNFKVHSLTGKTYTVEGLNATSTIYDIKRNIQMKSGIPVAEQRLVYKGKQLIDDHTIAEDGVSNEADLHIVLRLRGGMYNEMSGYKDTEGVFIYSVVTVNNINLCYHPTWTLAEFIQITNSAMKSPSPVEYTRKFFRVTALSVRSNDTKSLEKREIFLSQVLSQIQELRELIMQSDVNDGDDEVDGDSLVVNFLKKSYMKYY